MKCDKCGEELGNVGIYWQLKHFNECPQNKPIKYNSKIDKKTILEFFENINNKPKKYRGTTICGMMWVDDEYHALVTCNREGCKPCRDFDKAIEEVYIDETTTK